jgi:hypothetical protein
MGPYEKNTPGGNLFLLIVGWTHCSNILFSYWFSITTIKNPIVPNQKKIRKCHTNPMFFIWGSLVIFIRRRGGKQTSSQCPKSYVPMTHRKIKQPFWRLTFSGVIEQTMQTSSHLWVPKKINKHWFAMVCFVFFGGQNILDVKMLTSWGYQAMRLKDHDQSPARAAREHWVCKHPPEEFASMGWHGTDWCWPVIWNPVWMTWCTNCSCLILGIWPLTSRDPLGPGVPKCSKGRSWFSLRGSQAFL